MAAASSLQHRVVLGVGCFYGAHALFRVLPGVLRTQVRPATIYRVPHCPLAPLYWLGVEKFTRNRR